MAVGFNLSLSDLLLCEGFAKAFGEDNKPAINKFLFDNGLDVSMGVDEVVCKHRNLRGTVVDCLMYQGHERSDEWLRSGSASWDAIVDDCDVNLRIELKTIGQQSNNTRHILNEMQKHAN